MATGAYAEWFNLHPKSLAHVVPLLTLGLENTETAPAATLSLKDLSRECQFSVQPYSQLILSASMASKTLIRNLCYYCTWCCKDFKLFFLHFKEALRGGRLKQNECVRLMYTVGRVLSILPLETIIQYLDTIMFPCVNELHTLLGEEVINILCSIILKLLE